MERYCQDCLKYRKKCKKGSMYHNVFLSYGICKRQEGQIETPDANNCAFYDEKPEVEIYQERFQQ